MHKSITVLNQFQFIFIVLCYHLGNVLIVDYFAEPEENVAHPKYGTQVLQGEMRSALLDGNCHNYDMERGYTRHAISEAGDNGILIKLGTQCIVNHIKMLLWDKDLRFVTLTCCYHL